MRSVITDADGRWSHAAKLSSMQMAREIRLVYPGHDHRRSAVASVS